ncbi:AraC family transcriptional regulator [bacterium]|nr:MAG: AraC family transcriptional regulator [bacterium]
MASSTETVRFGLPEVASPFVTVTQISVAEGIVGRNRPHYHPATTELCTVAKGRLDWFVAEESYTVLPGETLVIPPDVVHGAVDANLQPCEIVAIHLLPDELPDKLVSPASSLSPQRLRLAEVASTVRRICAEHFRPSPYRDEIVAALAALLITTVLEHEESEEERTNGRLIRLAMRAMTGKDGVRPTVDDVADRLGVSSVWLHKLFVRETGVSPGDWARSKRLAEAKRMLEEGTSATVAIATKLGYASGQSFATAFRKESGMSPTEYRELHAPSESPREEEVFCVDMREVWEGGVLIYPR